MAANDQPSEIGLIGLAVVGQNLALNIADHGFRISVFNRTTEKMETFVDSHPDTPGGPAMRLLTMIEKKGIQSVA